MISTTTTKPALKGLKAAAKPRGAATDAERHEYWEYSKGDPGVNDPYDPRQLPDAKVFHGLYGTPTPSAELRRKFAEEDSLPGDTGD